MSRPPDGGHERAGGGLGVRLVDRTLLVAAPPERVFALLTTAEGSCAGWAPDADVGRVVDGVVT